MEPRKAEKVQGARCARRRQTGSPPTPSSRAFLAVGAGKYISEYWRNRRWAAADARSRVKINYSRVGRQSKPRGSMNRAGHGEDVGGRWLLLSIL